MGRDRLPPPTSSGATNRWHSFTDPALNAWAASSGPPTRMSRPARALICGTASGSKFVLTAANVHDSKVFEQLLDAIPPIKLSGRGRPRKRPKKLHADKGYDFPHCRRALHKRGIRVRIARRGKDSSRRLGRHRWVIEIV